MRKVWDITDMKPLESDITPSGAVELATLTSVPEHVLLFKMRCMFFFTVNTCLCALSERSTRSFSSLSASPFLWRPWGGP